MSYKIHSICILRLGKLSWTFFAHQFRPIVIIENYHLYILALFFVRLCWIAVFNLNLSRSSLSVNPISHCFSFFKTYLINSCECLITFNHLFRINLIVSDRVRFVENIFFEIFRAFDSLITELRIIYVRNIWITFSIWAIYILNWGWDTVIKLFLILRDYRRKKLLL